MLLALNFSGVYSSNPKGNHILLTEQLLHDYGPTFCRPVSDSEKTLAVEFVFVVTQIVEFVSSILNIGEFAICPVVWYVLVHLEPRSNRSQHKLNEALVHGNKVALVATL